VPINKSTHPQLYLLCASHKIGKVNLMRDAFGFYNLPQGEENNFEIKYI
jgi:hypothetical protein